MTEVLYNPKIKPEHLARKAIVYLRQSSEKQVRQNKESQLLQYAVVERVRALGWKQVEIINSDLGASAGLASAQREGFERVLSSVALGEVGIVGSREVSRLSRTDKDWCRRLEVCQIFGTLIADEQQVYDLDYLDDKLVLGIKGTLSVVELRVIRTAAPTRRSSSSSRPECAECRSKPDSPAALLGCCHGGHDLEDLHGSVSGRGSHPAPVVYAQRVLLAAAREAGVEVGV